MYIYAVIIIHNGRFRFLPSMCRLRMVKERNKNSKDIYQSKLINYEEGLLLAVGVNILERWSEYYQKRLNDENPI